MDRPDVRASDAEREQAVDLLSDAAAEGRLTFEELADRIDVASGTTTRGELARLTADLPRPAGLEAPVAAPVNVSSLLGDVSARVRGSCRSAAGGGRGSATSICSCPRASWSRSAVAR